MQKVIDHYMSDGHVNDKGEAKIVSVEIIVKS